MSESTKFDVEQYFKTLGEKEVKTLTELSNRESFTIGGKTFAFNKPTTRQWNALEQLRAEWEVETLKRGTKEYNPLIAKEKFARIYQKAAETYFGISENDFLDLPWPDMQMAVDACNFRALHGSAFL